MKKFLISVGCAGILVFSGCSVMDLVVDDVAVHNGLIDRMDAVLDSEGVFYGEYFALADGADTAAFVKSFDDFKTAVSELDKYYSETRFASSQKFFVDNYNKDYKPFITEYVTYAEEFTGKIKKDGYTLESMSSYFQKLDDYTVRFVDVHNKLIGEINTQADPV